MAKITFNYTTENYIPVPGIEPEPPGWKPGILATRPYRIFYDKMTTMIMVVTKMGVFLK